jgi:Ca2+-binding RTX toxin-like protein
VATNTLTGTTGNDILNAPGSVTTDVQGLQGNDTITLQLEKDIANAGQGADSILLNVTGAAKNTVFGGTGSDTITIGTAVLTNSTFIQGQDGNDSISLAGGAGFSVNNGVFVSGNKGNDTIAITAAATLATVQGGQDSDSLNFGAGGTSSAIRGGKGKDTLNLSVTQTFTGTTITANEGFDVISATGLVGTTTLLGGGKGGDSIAIGEGAIASVVGGFLNDTITSFGTFGGGVIYGDKTGVTTGSGLTGSSADGNDLISFTAGSTEAATIYGSGGNDTIDLLTPSAIVVDGGNNADVIGSTTLSVLIGASTLAGGSGHDTIKFATLASAMVFGGNGIDSIVGATASALNASINGGSGADSITFMGNAFGSAANMATINGGTGADVVTLGSYTQATGAVESGNVLGTVVYESGDKIILNATNSVNAGANWLGDTQIFIANNRASAALASTITGMSQAGSILVFAQGSDLILQTTRTAQATTGSLVNITGGSGLIKTTAVGNVTNSTSNFGFTIGTANNDIVITFT